jgi:hypothetical protein
MEVESESDRIRTDDCQGVCTLGLFLINASRGTLRHLSVIWFTVCSSLVHAGIMAMQAMNMPAELGHLFRDVPALVFLAAVLGVLTPRDVSSDTTANRQRP